MPTLQELRQQYPHYNDLSDQEFSDSFYNKFYSDMDRKEFDKILGVNQTSDTLKEYGKVAAAAVPKVITNTLGGAAAGATTLGGLESPSAALGYQNPFKGQGPPKSLSDVWQRMTTGGGGNITPPPDPGFLTEKAGKAIGGWPATDTSGKKILDATVQGTVGGFMGGGAGGIIPKATLYGALPGAASEYARQKTEGIKVPEWVPGVGGKDISPTVSAITAMLSPAPVRKRITPNTLNDPVRAQQYETAVRESGGKFKPTSGQLFEDQAQINKELAAEPGINRQQKSAVMQTATQHTGDPTTHITSDWVDRNMKRTGANIDDLERNTHIQHPTGNRVLPNGSTSYAYPDLVNVAMKRPQDTPGILKLIENTSSRLTPHASALPEEQIHSALFNSAGTRKLTGEEYKRLRSNLHSAAEGAGTPESAHAYRQTANALDNAMSSTSPAGKDWGQDWNKARREYAHTLVGQELAAKAKGGQTQFTPDEIGGVTKRIMGKAPWARGSLESAPFVSSAAAFKPLKAKVLPEEPSASMKAASYIPGARAVLNHAGPLGAAAGAYLGPHIGWGPAESAVLGAILGGETRKAVNMPHSPYLNPMNSVVQGYRKNQWVPKPEDIGTRNAVRGLFNLNTQDQNQ